MASSIDINNSGDNSGDINGDLKTLVHLTNRAEVQINTDFQNEQVINTQMLQEYYDNLMKDTSNSEKIQDAVGGFLNNDTVDTDTKFKFISKYFRWVPKTDLSESCVKGRIGDANGYGSTACLDTTLSTVWSSIVMPWLKIAKDNEDHQGMCPESNPLAVDGIECINTKGEIVSCSGQGGNCISYQAFPDSRGDETYIPTSSSNAPLTPESVWNNLDNNIKNDFITSGGKTLPETDSDWDNAPYLIGDKNLLNSIDSNVKNQLDNMQKYEEIRKSLLDNAPEQAQSSYNLAEAQVDDLTDKQITSEIMQNEASNIESNVDALRDLGVNKIRSAEINTYYAEQYREQIKIAKLLILIGLAILILTILRKQGILSQDINNILVAVVIVVGAYYAGGKIYNYYRRNNMNFQEFDYSTDVKPSGKEDNSESIWEDDKNQLEKIDVLDTKWWDCRGAECCGPHQKFNKHKQKCIDKPNGKKSQVQNLLDQANTIDGEASGDTTLVSPNVKEDKNEGSNHTLTLQVPTPTQDSSMLKTNTENFEPVGYNSQY